MVTFELRIEHTAEDEQGMNTFLVHIKDNYATTVRYADADSRSHVCRAELQFTAYTEAVAAVQDFRTAFSIDYRLRVKA